MSAPGLADDSAFAAVRCGEAFAALDLGTTYAKCLIAQMGPASAWNTAGAASVCYTARQVVDDGAAQADRLAAGVEALRMASERAIRLSGRAAHPSTCVVGVPMSRVSLRRGQAEVRRQQPRTPFGQGEADALARQASLTALHRQERSTAVAWLGPLATTWRADGRIVTSPIGFLAQHVTAEATHAFAPAGPVDVLQSWGKAQGLAALPLPEMLAFAELLRHRRPCLVLDAGGQRCDLYVKRSDGSLDWQGVPLGGHYFTRVLCAGGALSPSRAEAVKLAYADGRLRARSRLRLAVLLRRAADVWFARIREGLEALTPPLPGLWLTSGGHARLPECCRLPAAYADASMSRLESYPSLEPLTYGEAGLPLIPGPEALLPSHAVSFGLAQWVARTARDEQALSDLRRLALAAAREGYEVSGAWLTL